MWYTCLPIKTYDRYCEVHTLIHFRRVLKSFPSPFAVTEESDITEYHRSRKNA